MQNESHSENKLDPHLLKAEASERIRRIRKRYQTELASISIERARYYTESWRTKENRNRPLSVRVSLAMKNVYEKMRFRIDQDDRIAGAWTEHFLGVPIDIERGVFNLVLESELTRRTMLAFRARSTAKGLVYMLRKGALSDFIRNQKTTRATGTQPLNMELKTMEERKINPYRISPEDREVLLRKLLPYWSGRSLVDRLEKALTRSGLYSKDMHDFAIALPGNTSRQVAMLSTCATIATYQGHLILDYDDALRNGISKKRRQVRDIIQNKGGSEFLESVDLALEGVEIFANRLAEAVKDEMNRISNPTRKAELAKMLDICKRVPIKPARTFSEAVQSLWTIKTAVELAHPVNLHCYGRLDQTLWPYFSRDIQKGYITHDQALELLEELLLKIMSQNVRPESNLLGNFYHRYLGSSPVTVGGLDSDGNDATNELTYLILLAAHRSKAITNISVRIHPKTPDAVLLRLAEYLREGTSSYSLINDDVMIEGMRRSGFTEKDAADYAIMGCVEATCPGKTGSMSANAMQLVKLLDITLRNGDSAILAGKIRKEGLRTGTPDSFNTFEDILDALQNQGEYFIDKIVEGSNLRDRLFAEHLPAPVISAFMDGCLESGKDVTQGGATYDLSGISMINSIANLVDSLFVIKKLVFEKRMFTIEELLSATDANFIGHEKILREINKLKGKWGNGNPETDALAHRVTKGLFEYATRQRTFKGAPFVVYVISMITHTIDGRLSIASPDGRRAATPYAASCNPYNVDRSGITAVLNSVASLPNEKMLGCAVNVKFHPTGLGDRMETRAKWVALIRAYFKQGGAQIQPTAACAEDLRNAQKDPSSYGDLIVKVGGYSTYFVDLGKEIQDEIIARTEH